MGKFKKVFSVIIIAISAIVLTACGGSKKPPAPVKAQSISTDILSADLMLNESLDINYTIRPNNSVDNVVSISVDKPDVIQLSTNEMVGITGKFSIKGLAVDEVGSRITIKVKGTEMETTVLVKVYAEPQQLSKPNSAKMKIVNDDFVFHQVENAKSYLVNINGIDYTVEDEKAEEILEHDVKFKIYNNDQIKFLAKNQCHTIKVKALSDDKLHFTDSEYSEEYKFIKLGEVENVKINQGLISWDNNELANRYDVYVNGELTPLTQTQNFYRLNVSQSGTYKIQIRASFNGVDFKNEQGAVVYPSELSEEYVINKLDKTTISLFNDVQDGEKTGNSKIIFTSVEGAEKYKISFSPALKGNNNIEILQTDALEIEIDDRFLEGKEYEITILPIGNNLTSINAEITKFSFKTAPKLTGFKIENNILTFDAVKYVSGYELVLIDKQQNEVVITSMQALFNLDKQFSEAGIYSFYIKALGRVPVDGGTVVNMTNGKLQNIPLTIEKLASPTVKSVSNSAMVEFDVVDNAIEYQIYLDNSYQGKTYTNQFQFDAKHITEGSHIVKVVSIGNGRETISGSLENAIEYEFFKLDPVSVITKIERDAIYFDAVVNAVSYSIKFNDGASQIIAATNGLQRYSLENEQNILDVNKILIIVNGDDKKFISSKSVEFEVRKSSVPTNLRIEDGIFKWDILPDVEYKVFVNDSQIGIDANGEFQDVNLVGQILTLRVKAYPITGFLSSDFAEFQVTKLTQPQNVNVEQKLPNSNILSNYKLTWDMVENANGYTLNIQNADGTLNKDIILDVTEMDIPEDYASGKYEVQIYANGKSSIVSGEGFINSYVTNFSFSKLDTPANLKVANNILQWEYLPKTESPINYMLCITYFDEEIVYKEINGTSFNINLEEKPIKSIKVRACGDSKSLITGNYSEEILITKLNTISNITVENGQIVFYDDNNAEVLDKIYNIYLDDVLVEDKNIFTSDNKNILDLNIKDSEIHKVCIEVCADNYLDSEKSKQLKFQKLEQVSNFVINNDFFEYVIQPNVSNYEITDNISQSIITKSNGEQIRFSQFGHVEVGEYRFNIRALGTKLYDDVGVAYLTSDYSVNAVVVKVVPPPTAKIENSELVITESTLYKATQYKVELKSNGLPENVLINKTFDKNNLKWNLKLESLPVGNYTITISSIGNNADIVASTQTFKLDNVAKLGDTTDLRIENGKVLLTLNQEETVDVYLDDIQNFTNYNQPEIIFEKLNLGQEYFITVVLHKDGAIDSDKSKKLSVTKLPNVNNLNIANGLSLKEFIIKWEKLDTLKYNDYDKFAYDIKVEPTLNNFNEKITDNGNISNILITLENENIYEFDFSIRALGTKLDKEKGFLNGSFGTPLHVERLKEIENISKQNNMLTWTNVNINNLGIKLKITQLEVLNQEFVFDLAKDCTEFDVVSNLQSGLYEATIIATGNMENGIIDSIGNLPVKFQILNKVKNISSTNGYLNFGELETNTVYEVYINDELQMNFNGIPTFASLDELKYINSLMQSELPYNLKIKIVPTVEEVGLMIFSSGFSENFIIEKLPQVNSLYFQDKKLNWLNVKGASKYIIHAINLDDGTTDGEIFGTSGIYNEELNALVTVSNYIDFPNILEGNYEFYVIPIAAITDTLTNPKVYLAGDESLRVETTVLGSPSNLRVENGIVKWDAVANNSILINKYQVTLKYLEDESLNTPENIITESFVTSKTEVSLEELKYLSRVYTINVVALGNGSTTQDSNNLESITNVYKPNLPEKFKVYYGFLSWEMPFSNAYMQALNNGEYSKENKEKVVKAILGQIDDEAFTKKYSFMSNLEVTINGITKISKPYIIELTEDDSAIRFIFDFDLKEEKEYRIKLRYLGDNFDNTNTVNIIGVGATDTTEQVVVTNYVNGLFTTEITGLKLSPPQTPVTELMTMIKNDKLYFAKIGRLEEVVDYVIIAKPKLGGKSIKKIIQNDKYLTEDGNMQLSNTHCVPIKDIGLEEGVSYIISVRALGTKDSDLIVGSEKIYYSSAACNSTTIVALKTPELMVIEGQINFAQSIEADHLSLKIWSKYDEKGLVIDKFNKNKESDKVVMFNLDIYKETEYEYLTLNNNYSYSLKDNKMFKPGVYFVTVDAVGDGINVISSLNGIVMEIEKLPQINNVYVKDGKFVWEIESENPKRFYGISIYQLVYANNNGEKGEFIAETPNLMMFRLQEKEIMSSIKSENGNKLCEFDLPPDQSLSWGNKEQIYTYKIKVWIAGIEDSRLLEKAQEEKVAYVDSDTVLTKDYERLQAPTIGTKEGKVIWDKITNAGSYVVKMGWKTQDEIEQGLQVNSFELNFDGKSLETGFTYSVMVRAIANKADDTSKNYLNSIYSNEINAGKLVKPNLRVEDGVIKWNVLDLDSSLGKFVELIIIGPKGFEKVEGIFESNLAMNGENGYPLFGDPNLYPVGDYTVKVKFIGGTVEGTNNFWFDSDMNTLTVPKIQTLTIEREIKNKIEDEDGEKVVKTEQFVKTKMMPNANNYVFTVVKYDEQHQVLKEHKFKFNINVPQEYFELSNDYVYFNLQAVSDYDEKDTDTIKFGYEYHVYVQAYGDSALMSNNSNEIFIEDAKTPTNVRIGNIPGLIMWDNVSPNTCTTLTVKTMLANGSVATDVIDIPYTNVSSIMAQTIGTIIEIQVISYIKTDTDNLYSSPVIFKPSNGEYKLYETGNGVTIPYKLANVEQILNIKYNLNARYELSTNIEIDETTYSQNLDFVIKDEFNGIFDGKNFEIKMLYNTKINSVFEKIGSQAIVTNLVVNYVAQSQTSVNTKSKFAGIALINNGIIKNSKVVGEMKYSKIITYSGVTLNNNGTIWNVVNKLNITSEIVSDGNVSGIALINNGRIVLSGNEAKLYGKFISGIASENNNEVSYCYNMGEFYIINNEAKVSGIVNYNAKTIKNSYSILKVINNNSYESYEISGIASGNDDAIVQNCYVVVKQIFTTQFELIGQYCVFKKNYAVIESGLEPQVANNCKVVNKDDLQNLISTDLEFSKTFEIDNSLENGYLKFKASLYETLK